MSPTVRDEGMTHHVGDDCPGGHEKRPQPDTRAVVQQLVEALETLAGEHAVGVAGCPKCHVYDATMRAGKTLLARLYQEAK